MLCPPNSIEFKGTSSVLVWATSINCNRFHLVLEVLQITKFRLLLLCMVRRPADAVVYGECNLPSQHAT